MRLAPAEGLGRVAPDCRVLHQLRQEWLNEALDVRNGSRTSTGIRHSRRSPWCWRSRGRSSSASNEARKRETNQGSARRVVSGEDAAGASGEQKAEERAYVLHPLRAVLLCGANQRVKVRVGHSIRL